MHFTFYAIRFSAEHFELQRITYFVMRNYIIPFKISFNSARRF